MSLVPTGDEPRFAEMRQVVELYVQNKQPGVIAKELGLRRVDVLNHIDEWKRTAVGSEAMKDRVAAPQVEILPELYGANPAHILESIRTATIPADPRRLLLVGHNPGMHEVALMLMGRGDPAGAKALGHNLPTAGLAIFDFDVKDWGDVAYRRGKLVLFVSPKLLRQG